MDREALKTTGNLAWGEAALTEPQTESQAARQPMKRHSSCPLRESSLRPGPEAGDSKRAFWKLTGFVAPGAGDPLTPQGSSTLPASQLGSEDLGSLWDLHTWSLGHHPTGPQTSVQNTRVVSTSLQITPEILLSVSNG